MSVHRRNEFGRAMGTSGTYEIRQRQCDQENARFMDVLEFDDPNLNFVFVPDAMEIMSIARTIFFTYTCEMEITKN